MSSTSVNDFVTKPDTTLPLSNSSCGNQEPALINSTIDGSMHGPVDIGKTRTIKSGQELMPPPRMISVLI